MFAILKFQQRTNAATFSHAFVLTIRICPSSEESLFNMRYPIVKEADAGATFQDLSVSLDIEEKGTKPVTCAIDKLKEASKETTISHETKELDENSDCKVIDDPNEISEIIMNSQDDNATDSADPRESRHARTETAVATANMHIPDKPDVEFRDDTYEDKFESSVIEGDAKRHCTDFAREKSSRTCNETARIETENAENLDREIESTITKKQHGETINNRKYKMFSSTDPPLTGEIKHDTKKWSLSNRFSFTKDSTKRSNACASNDEDHPGAKKMTSEDIVGPLYVPYEYFIGEEMKNARHDVLNIDQPVQTNNLRDTNVKGVRTSEEDVHVCTLLNDDNQSQSNAYNKSCKIRKPKTRTESERKTVPEDKVLRSSDITDLVMEGLMFTIKQDKDSVAVIEQKTKLEVDEVLENSEKVETQAGEKCLLNSSLLRLENLVTMIDTPREKRSKTGHASGNSAHPLPLANLPSCAARSLSDVNYADRKLNKSRVLEYNRYYRMKELMSLVPYRPRYRQHHRVFSDVNDNTNSSARTDLLKDSERSMEWQDHDNERNKGQMKTNEVEREGEDDIVFESLPSMTIFSEETGLQSTELLMDDEEDTRPANRCDSTPEKCSDRDLTETRTTAISAVPDERKLHKVSMKRKLNVPRVVSDKPITVEQMPVALQRVLQHKYRTRRFPPATISSEASSEASSRHDKTIQHSARTGHAIPETSVSVEDDHATPDVANESIETTKDPEETKRDEDDDSGARIDKDEPGLKINNGDAQMKSYERYIHKRHARRSGSTETHRFSRRRSSSTSKHGSPRKLQDITEDFYYDLMQHAHNEDNIIRQRCLRQRRMSLDNPDDLQNGKVRIEMLKFIQDITEGVRVVVKRLDMNHESSLA